MSYLSTYWKPCVPYAHLKSVFKQLVFLLRLYRTPAARSLEKHTRPNCLLSYHKNGRLQTNNVAFQGLFFWNGAVLIPHNTKGLHYITSNKPHREQWGQNGITNPVLPNILWSAKNTKSVSTLAYCSLPSLTKKGALCCCVVGYFTWTPFESDAAFKDRL